MIRATPRLLNQMAYVGLGFALLSSLACFKGTSTLEGVGVVDEFGTGSIISIVNNYSEYYFNSHFNYHNIVTIISKHQGFRLQDFGLGSDFKCVGPPKSEIGSI